MTWQEAMDYLLNRLPMFQRQGPAAYRADLSNIHAISEILGNPEKKMKCIHIAGTNGKGSVTHLIAAALQTSGYKTGIYSSPHYLDYRERLKINGVMITEDAVKDFLKTYKNRLEKLDASFFEITTGMTFWYFREMKTDWAVIETGLGGRLDCTNIIQPSLSVITNIGYDHMNILGDTLPAIASEKAGIIKGGIPVLIGEKQEDLSYVFESKAKQLNSPLFYASQRVQIEGSFTFGDPHFSLTCHDFPDWNGSYESGLCGAFQKKNYSTAIAALSLLQKKGIIEISQPALTKGIKEVSPLTYFMGRFMKLSGHDRFFADSAHNESGIRMLMESIRSMPFRRMRIAFGTVADKDPGLVLQNLPKEAAYYFCRADQPRAMDSELLKEMASSRGLHGQAFPDVNSAISAMLRESEPDDLLILTGSVFVVADALKTQQQGLNASLIFGS